MKKIFFLIALLIGTVYAAPTVAPSQSVHIDGNAKDMVVQAPLIYVGTSHGKLQVYDLVAKKFTKEITLPKIKDFMGDEIFAAAASIDHMDGRYLLLSDSGEKGYTDLWIHEKGVTKKLLSARDKKALVKARFVDKDHILLGFLSNEAALLEVSTKKELYRVQLTESKFSDLAINKDHTQAVFSCESGAISVIDTHTGKVLKELKGLNKDNVYKVDFQNGYVSAAGQDRRAAYYRVATGQGNYFQATFLIYATGLSPSASKVAFAMDENNNITVYDLHTHTKIALLKGQRSTLNSIVFIGENTLISGSDDDTVLVWKIPEQP
jgi:WD40 repeat protein